jgi:hypothetical protein
VGLESFTCWNCGFESFQEHGCLSLVGVVCCQVEVTAPGRSLVQRSPNDCDVYECGIQNVNNAEALAHRAVETMKKFNITRIL